jgi:hypothetical protein
MSKINSNFIDFKNKTKSSKSNNEYIYNNCNYTNTDNKSIKSTDMDYESQDDEYQHEPIFFRNDFLNIQKNKEFINKKLESDNSCKSCKIVKQSFSELNKNVQKQCLNLFNHGYLMKEKITILPKVRYIDNRFNMVYNSLHDNNNNYVNIVKKIDESIIKLNNIVKNI